ncbi:MAG: UDP-N-acetylglucosamine 2-epimerase (non-hydrolyzing) [Bacillota bacterium]
MKSKRIICTFGTRPEAIKMAPVVKQLQGRNHWEVSTVVTGQHREMLKQVMDLFGLRASVDLDIMSHAQSLTDITTRCLGGLEPVFSRMKPDLVLVHGDTTTTLAAALSAFYGRVPVGHVEAGLRTFDPLEPFPEEMNRVLTDRISSLHFAPTDLNRRHLERESVSGDTIFVTGNTAIDALLEVTDSGYIFGNEELRCTPWGDSPLVVCDVHRRESFGEPIRSVARALARLVTDEDLHLVVSVHPNPEVKEPLLQILEGCPNISLVEPLHYGDWANLMARSHFVITDSGGLQEEAPALGVPVLLTRDKTERPEAVEAGTVLQVGGDGSRLFDAARRLLRDPGEHARMSGAPNPYGDGKAARRIADYLEWYWDFVEERPVPFAGPDSNPGRGGR